MPMRSHGAIVFGIPALERALSTRIRMIERGGHHHHHHQSLSRPQSHVSTMQCSFPLSARSQHCYLSSRTRISTSCDCTPHRAVSKTRSTLSSTFPAKLGSNEKRACVARRWYYRHNSQQHHQQQQQQRCTLSTNSSEDSSTINTTLAAATPTASSSSSYSHILSSTLQQFLLRPRSIPLPRYLTPRHYTYTLSETFGHASFVLVAISYSTSDFLLLRLLAVLGSTSMLLFTYFHPHGRVLWLPLKWNLLFIGINLYRIGKVYYYRYCATNKVSEAMKKFREEHLSTIDPIDYYKLLQLATVESFEEGTMVMQQGQVNPYVRIVLEGELQVLRDGTLTYVLEEGMFVSEGGLHAGLMLRGGIESCCSIVVGPKFDGGGDEQQSQQYNNNGKQPHVNDDKSNTHPTKQVNRVRCLRWNRSELVDLLHESSNNSSITASSSSSGVDGGSGGGLLLGNALRAALSWDIVRKLKSQRHMLTEGRVKDPTSWSRKREEQGIARYASLLQNMLRHYSSDKEDDFLRMRETLAKYRGIHRIDDESHEKALAKCGWTVEEFRSGERRRNHRTKKTANEIIELCEELDDEDDDYLGDSGRRDGFDDENSPAGWGRRVLVRFFQ